MSAYQLGAKSEAALRSIAAAGGVEVHFRQIPARERAAVVHTAHLLIGMGLIIDHNQDPRMHDGARTYSLTPLGRTAIELFTWTDSERPDGGVTP